MDLITFPNKQPETSSFIILGDIHRVKEMADPTLRLKKKDDLLLSSSQCISSHIMPTSARLVKVDKDCTKLTRLEDLPETSRTLDEDSGASEICEEV